MSARRASPWSLLGVMAMVSAAAFRAAAAPGPEDPRALSELAWASFLAGDLATARKSAAQAAYLARTPSLRAMAYYNLGRACEALGDAVAAQGAYAASLHLRDHREVRARLKRLAPALLTPHRLAGPFARPEALCQVGCEVEREVTPRWSGAASLTAPFRDAVKLEAEDPGGDLPLVSIALQLDDGWYVLPGIGRAARGHGGSHNAELRMVGQRLVVDWHSEIGRFGHHDEHSIFVCGVGAARQPSCVGPLVIEQALHIDRCGKDIDCTDRGTSSVWFHCRAELRGDVVQVTRDPSEIWFEPGATPEPPRPDACDALPVSGTHALTF